MLKNAGDLISEAQQSVSCLDVAGAKAKLDECPDAVILDVREESSAQNSKLDKSINISRGLLEMMVHKHCPNAETVILTHCGGGGRASLAAHTLKNMGYQNVYAITASYEDIKKILD